MKIQELQKEISEVVLYDFRNNDISPDDNILREMISLALQKSKAMNKQTT